MFICCLRDEEIDDVTSCNVKRGEEKLAEDRRKEDVGLKQPREEWGVTISGTQIRRSALATKTKQVLM